MPTSAAALPLVRSGRVRALGVTSSARWPALPDVPTISELGGALADYEVTGWFGLLATALNLFPVGQLDGGHISYAVFGRRSSTVTLVTVGAACVLSYFSSSWIVWTVLTVVLLLRFGRHHPPVFDEDAPLDRGRLILAGVALLIFVGCFTPASSHTVCT